MSCLRHGVPSVVLLTLIVVLPAGAMRSLADDPPADLPVDVAALEQGRELTGVGIRNLIALPQLWSAIGSGRDGLTLDLSHVSRLLDGTEIDPVKVYGTAYVGPYPFESKEATFTYKRFRTATPISAGRATLGVGALLRTKLNSEDWTDCGTVAVRLELYLETPGRDRPLGTYDTFASFRKTDLSENAAPEPLTGRSENVAAGPRAGRSIGYRKLPSLVEGPLINRVTSDDPSRVLISFITDEQVPATVVLADGRQVHSPAARHHRVTLTGLQPAAEYVYRVKIGDRQTRPYRFRSAPPRGRGPVTFAYCSDSREGVGGGTLNFMGVNFQTLERLAALSWAQQAEFFIVGGDLISGYTTSRADFEAQLYGWTQALSGFWHARGVYPAMGNHEALLRVYKFEDGQYASVDRWPYQTDSAEAVFAEWFANPTNGPKPADARRPPYDGNVFSFQYGHVKVIAFNNNYWRGSKPARFGGAPEGYMFDDQLGWIEQELRQAEADPTVKYVFLYGQEPVFPCGGHIGDAMWYDGDNNVRAYVFENGRLRPEPQGIVEVRNRFVRAVAASSKAVAVLAGDEHAYVRVLIDEHVPIGESTMDDKNGDGKIAWRKSEPASPLSDLRHPTWYITCGGGGAPYYAQEPAPWNQHWLAKADPRAGYYYSSQENVVIFQATDEQVTMRVYNPCGEIIEQIADLTAVKR